MVDKALFIGTSGANNSMHELEIITNNLANVNTTGFRGDYEVMKQYQVNQSGEQTRTYSEEAKTYSDFKPGPVTYTDRELDVAVANRGFLSVQSKSGKEAYTRAGDLQLSKDGLLMTRAGDLVLGRSGVINASNAERISISSDGTISAIPKGEHQAIVLDRLKLTNPPIKDLAKGPDGLFYTPDGKAALEDPTVKLTPKALEGSNVNPVETLTTLIELSRQFEMHTNMMKTMSDEASKANQILEIPR